MSFPRYSKYKACGVEWLGDVPEGWEVKRLKYTLHLLTEKTDRREHPVALENIEGWTGRFISTETEFQGEGVAFDAGDILFGKLRPYLAKVYRAESSGEAVGDFHVLRPLASISSRFAQYQLLNREFIAIVDGSTFGSKMPRASWEFVGGMRVPVPPLAEQVAIAAFLDRETAKIDALIAEQRRLIELLKEKRQAVISHAVTKGLNPNAKMKPSGVEWLGDIPEHWEVKKMKQVSSLKGRLGWQGLKADEYQDEGPFVVSSAHFDNFAIDWDSCPHVTPERYDLDSNIQLCKGDVLLMKDGAALGKLAYLDYLPDCACLNSHLLLFRPLIINKRATYISKFLFFLMRTDFFQKHINLNATGTTFAGISQEKIGNYLMALPPLEEQSTIVEFLQTETTNLDSLTTEAQRAIDLLQERRTALISAAVTGQIDVRNITTKETA